MDKDNKVYLDNAATAPIAPNVISVIENYYEDCKVNVHRGMYNSAQLVTDQFELVRSKMAKFINAPEPENIVFTSGATDSLNMVAFGFATKLLNPGDHILTTVLEHHSNFVCWQQVANQTGASLDIVHLDNNGYLDQSELSKLLKNHPKIVAISMMSNVLGTVQPIKSISKAVHDTGGYIVVDAAQAIPHLPVDVQDLDVDFLAFSGHKLYGPTGIGVLYGKLDLLNQMNPVRFGGEMIDNVTETETTFQPAPIKFEAGTPNIAGVLGLGAAIDYLSKQDFDNLISKERRLICYLFSELEKIPNAKLYGPKEAYAHTSVISFNIANYHPHDVATILDNYGVEVRAGHHCAMPLMQELHTESVVRVSLSFLNTEEDIDQLIFGLKKVADILS